MMFICLLSSWEQKWILFCRKASVMILQLPLEMHLTTYAQNLTSFKKPCDLKRKYGLQLGLYLALPTAFSVVPSKVWDIAKAKQPAWQP